MASSASGGETVSQSKKRKKAGGWGTISVERQEPVTTSSPDQDLAAEILSWQISSNDAIPPFPPPDVVQHALAYSKEGKQEFGSVEEYIQFFRFLLLEDVREHLNSLLLTTISVKVSRVTVMRSVQFFNYHELLLKCDIPSGSFASNDCVAFKFALYIDKGSTRSCKVLGIVQDGGSPTRNTKNTGFFIRIHIDSKCSDPFIKLLRDNPGRMVSFADSVHLGEFKNEQKVFIHIYSLDSLITSMRQVRALNNCSLIPILDWVLCPRNFIKQESDMAQWNRLPPPIVEHLHKSLNSSQFEACQVAMCRPKGFTLLQGPPGTGKTKTIVAILNCFHLVQYQFYYDSLVHFFLDLLFVNQALESSTPAKVIVHSEVRKLIRKKPRILVCAPSNAGVDEILDRLFVDGLLDGDLKKYTPDMVRIGQSERMRTNIKNVMSLNALADAFTEYQMSELAERVNQYSMKSQQCFEALAVLQKRIHQINQTDFADEKERDDIRHRNAVKFSAMVEDWYRINLELTRCNIFIKNSKTHARDLVKKSYLDEAQIVFATLSGSASSELNLSDSKFDICLIDEAAQGVELSTLIPLLFGITRCVLVGDPKQLPATVFLNGSIADLFQQSMFQRFQQSGYPVTLLDEQYRMHPQISAFPSLYFYDSLVKDAPNVKSDSYNKPWHACPQFGPFVFHDVSIAETRKGTSCFNLAECLFICDHLKSFLAQFEDFDVSKLGIITPYREQKIRLQDILVQELGNDVALRIEIDTVDSFQGREKDVIMFSCVRSASFGIGFLADIRRMNVGITRAKFSLWIVGNSVTLSYSAPWKALIEYSKEHDLFMQVPDDLFTKSSRRSLLLKPASQPRTSFDKIKEDVAITKPSSPSGNAPNAETTSVSASQPLTEAETPPSEVPHSDRESSAAMESERSSRSNSIASEASSTRSDTGYLSVIADAASNAQWLDGESDSKRRQSNSSQGKDSSQRKRSTEQGTRVRHKGPAPSRIYAPRTLPPPPPPRRLKQSESYGYRTSFSSPPRPPPQNPAGMGYSMMPPPSMPGYPPMSSCPPDPMNPMSGYVASMYGQSGYGGYLPPGPPYPMPMSPHQPMPFSPGPMGNPSEYSSSQPWVPGGMHGFPPGVPYPMYPTYLSYPPQNLGPPAASNPFQAPYYPVYPQPTPPPYPPQIPRR